MKIFHYIVEKIAVKLGFYIQLKGHKIEEKKLLKALLSVLVFHRKMWCNYVIAP